MNPLRRIILSILASLSLLALSATAWTQVTSGQNINQASDAPSSTDAGSLQKKAAEVQVRVNANNDDRDQLKKAIKLNEIAQAKEILLRNGLTAKDLDNAKITLRTGGGKGAEDEIEISATCCDPKEITIRRGGENYIK